MTVGRMSELKIRISADPNPDGTGRVHLLIEDVRPSTTEGVTVFVLQDSLVPPATIVEFIRFHVDSLAMELAVLAGSRKESDLNPL